MKIKNSKLKNRRVRLIGAAYCAATLLIGAAQAQTGGSYAVKQSVIAAGGGRNSTGGTFSLAGTVGQPTGGQTLTGAPYALNAGFWTPTGFAPTAAVTLCGRVTTANGAGIRNVLVTLTGANGATRTVITGRFGFYSFTDAAAGETYIISVSAKRFRFAQNTRIHSATADFANINFVADDPDPNIRLPLNTPTPND